MAHGADEKGGYLSTAGCVPDTDAPRRRWYVHLGIGDWFWEEPDAMDARKEKLWDVTRTPPATLRVDSKELETWECIDTAENIYNRAAFFPSHGIILGLHYFGDGLKRRLYSDFSSRALEEWTLAKINESSRLEF